MINSNLLALIEHNPFAALVSDVFSEATKAFNSLNTISPSNFEDRGTHYAMTIDVAEEQDVDNIEISLDDENVVTVKYEDKSDNMSYKSSISQTLPEDAMADTLEAVFEDGQIVITVDKQKQVKKAKKHFKVLRK